MWLSDLKKSMHKPGPVRVIPPSDYEMLGIGFQGAPLVAKGQEEKTPGMKGNLFNRDFNKHQEKQLRKLNTLLSDCLEVNLKLPTPEVEGYITQIKAEIQKVGRR